MKDADKSTVKANISLNGWNVSWQKIKFWWVKGTEKRNDSSADVLVLHSRSAQGHAVKNYK